jgi:hypothetical protein
MPETHSRKFTIVQNLRIAVTALRMIKILDSSIMFLRHWFLICEAEPFYSESKTEGISHLL